MIPKSRPEIIVHLAAGALDHDHHLDGAWNFSEASSALAFSGTFAAAAQTLVRSDQNPGVGALDAAGQRLGRKAAEDDEWTAPIRAQASIAWAASGIMGR